MPNRRLATCTLRTSIFLILISTLATASAVATASGLATAATLATAAARAAAPVADGASAKGAVPTAGASAPDTTPEFLAPPYLFTQAGEKIKISWSYEPTQRPIEPVSAILNQRWGRQKLNVTQENELYTAELPIATCGFDENLTYQVTGMMAAEKINAIPCPDDDMSEVKFVFLADTQANTKDGTKPVREFAERAARFGAQAVVIGGDLVQTGAKFNLWTQFFRAMQPALKQTMLVPVMGNHEYHGDSFVPNWAHFFKVEASEASYTTYLGEVQIIALNSSFTDDPSLVLPQKLWLESQLMLTQPRWRIVVFHHPPFSIGLANSPLYPKKEFKTLQQEYVPLFEKYHVDLVLNGHVHLFERSEKEHVQYLITGPAGGKIGAYGGTNPHSIKAARIRTMIELTASHNQLTASTIDLQGHVVDELKLKK